MGTIKPNPNFYKKAFEITNKKFNLPKENCIVFDDEEENLKSAKKSGINNCFLLGQETVNSVSLKFLNN